MHVIKLNIFKSLNITAEKANLIHKLRHQVAGGLGLGALAPGTLNYDKGLVHKKKSNSLGSPSNRAHLCLSFETRREGACRYFIPCFSIRLSIKFPGFCEGAVPCIFSLMVCSAPYGMSDVAGLQVSLSRRSSSLIIRKLKTMRAL